MNGKKKLNQKAYNTIEPPQHNRRGILVTTDGSNNTNNILLLARKRDYEAFYVDIR